MMAQHRILAGGLCDFSGGVRASIIRRPIAFDFPGSRGPDQYS